uniref:Uncharacterized protein n=1 Tax=Rhizophora mucronata TaxID=61149 RepID=A0A2P2NQG2_RHIMU
MMAKSGWFNSIFSVSVSFPLCQCNIQ